MIMLNVLPSSYHQLVSSIVHSTKTKDFILSLIRQSILQENSLRKATWSHGSANLASRIGEPAYAEAHWTTMIWSAPTNVKCSKYGKTNHTTDHCWFLTREPPFKPSKTLNLRKDNLMLRSRKLMPTSFIINLRTRRKVKTKQVHILPILSWHALQASLKYQKMNP